MLKLSEALLQPAYVAIDLGNRNLLGVAHCAAGQDAASTRLATYTVSTRAYRERTGEAGRARKAALQIIRNRSPVRGERA